MEIVSGWKSCEILSKYLCKAKCYSIFLGITLLLLWFTPQLFAQDSLKPDANGWVAIPKKPEPFHLVNDFADILSIEEEKDLEAQLSEYEKEHRIQLVVLTTKTTGNSLAKAFAQATYDTWNISYSHFGYTILLLVSADDKTCDIGFCYEFEKYLSSTNVDKIIAHIAPHFYDRKRYFDGIVGCVDSLFNIVPKRNPYVTREEFNRIVEANKQEKERKKFYVDLFNYGKLLLYVIGLVKIYFFPDKRWKYKLHPVPGRFNNYR